MLHVTSLPSPYGIGDFGPSSIQWIDRLADSGQTWWQILPIGPPDLGNSPYTPLSTFACNPLLISPDELVVEGLLSKQDLAAVTRDHEPFDDHAVQFDAVIALKTAVLDLAWRNFEGGRAVGLSAAIHEFAEQEASWLDDFALFRALKDRFDEAEYVDWPAEFLRRDATAMHRAAIELDGSIRRTRFEQFLALRQLERLRQHARSRHVKLFGDLPIFVSADSADVWAHPDLFYLDESLRPKFVAGVPPDYFSQTGQLWGNPVYRWAAIRRGEYAWWIDRLRSLLSRHDIIRLDHFRGFAAAWHIPAGSSTAETGHWVDGPGEEFFHEVRRALGGLPFVAEDLGTITDDVRQLLSDFGLPKMGVVQFAFDGDPHNAFLPHHLVHNMVAYTGTHDNDTSRGWYLTLDAVHQDLFWQYLRRDDASVPADDSVVARRVMELAWKSDAAVAIAPLQDLLNLGSEARMNTPGVAAGNWGWRCTQSELCGADWQGLREMTEQAGRCDQKK